MPNQPSRAIDLSAPILQAIPHRPFLAIDFSVPMLQPIFIPERRQVKHPKEKKKVGGPVIRICYDGQPNGKFVFIFQNSIYVPYNFATRQLNGNISIVIPF